MKKLKVLIMLIAAALSAFALTACASGAPSHSVENPDYAIAPTRLEQIFDEFMDGREDRTSYSDGEEKAALYINDKLVGYGYTSVEVSEFEYIANDATKYTSQNVIAIYPSKKGGSKNVIIGAYYDNQYNAIRTNNLKPTQSPGALANGTGVATLLAIDEYLMTEQPEYDFNVISVFLGASAATTYGTNKFWSKLDASVRAETVLMIELQRLGVDYVYAFSDARKTGRESFFDSVAAAHRLDIHKTPNTAPQITGTYALSGVPYVHWEQEGVFSTFFEAGIPTLNLVGANWETMDLSDTESATNADIAATADDNATNLKRLYPDFADKMATAAALVVESFGADGFLATMQADKNSFPDTQALTRTWIWYLVVVGALIIAAGIMSLVCSRLAKKYPPEPPKIKNVKMAVFGMDYEDKDPDSIYIDIRRPGGDDIFPGVPNNEPSAPVDPFGFGAPEKREEPPEDKGE